MKSFKIRQVTMLDLAALQAIGRKTFSETFAGSNSAENMAAYLAEGFSEKKLTEELKSEGAQFFFALHESDIIGYLKINFGNAQTEPQDPNALEIERIYVLQKYHGKQVGALLYEHALAIAKARKAPYIWLGVWEKNPRAIRFYQKQGFEEFDQHIFQLGDEAQTDIMMKLNLPD